MLALRCICFSVELWAITVYECAFWVAIQDRAKQRPKVSLETYWHPGFRDQRAANPLNDAVLSPASEAI